MEQMSRRAREKQTREEEILIAAEKVFFEKGFHETTMDEIAYAAQFSKKTLYLYFINKEDLFFSVASRNFKHAIRYFEKALYNGRTGIEKIRMLCEAYYAYYMDFSEAFELINYCQYIQTTRKGLSHYKEIEALRGKIYLDLVDVLESGKVDGSIRQDLIAKEAAISLFLLITGLFSRFAELKKNSIDLGGNEHERLIFSAIDLVERSIRR